MERNRLANALSLSDEFRTICRARSARRFEQGRRVVALVSFCNRTRVCRNPTLTLRPRGHPNTGAPGSTFFGRPPLTPRTLNDIYHRKSSTATTGRVETLGRGRPCRITGEGLSPAISRRSDHKDTCRSSDRSGLNPARRTKRATRPDLSVA